MTSPADAQAPARSTASHSQVLATLLAIGDVHLGTRPASLPAGLDGWGVDPSQLTPEAALREAVERALAEGVDAVLFAGDVVESTNARFEALRPLETAVRRLAEAGIAVLAVAGNHDVEALPRLARRIEGFHLLGEGGRWEGFELAKAGRPVAQVLGWSFPQTRVTHSPVAELLREPPAAVPGLARIGLLHGDLGASGGSYAPFQRHELEAARLDAWLLGHIHKPSLVPSAEGGGALPCGYLGSLVGLDPTEVGRHGPWRVEVHAGGRVAVEPLGQAPLRWERLDVALSPDADPTEAGDALLDAATAHAEALAARGEAARVLGVRARLTGATPHYEALRRDVEAGLWNGCLNRDVGETLVFVDKVYEGLSLAVDLETLARGDDPPGLLARKLRVLERPPEDETRRELLAAARRALAPAAEASRWLPLREAREPRDPLAEEALAARLRQAGMAALGALLAQRRGEGAERSPEETRP